MSLQSYVEKLRAGEAAQFPADANSQAFAQSLDAEDKLAHLRDEFILPTKSSLKKKALDGTIPGTSSLPLAAAATTAISRDGD